MKTKKSLMALLIVFCLILTACGGGGAPAAEPDSEKAMENFLAKLEAGNYVMNAKDYLKTTVASRDQVVFEYTDDLYNDFAAVSVGSEAFQGSLNGGKFAEVGFLGEGQAIDAAKKRLPNYWMDESVSGGNIWNLFYNIQEEPLKFVSHDETVQRSLLSFVGYNENALRLMHDVYMVFDTEDPDTVHLQAEVDEDLVARINYDDIDVEITFGNAESNAAVDAWVSDPSYPEARTAWTDTDEFIFNSVFLPGYGLEAIPFMPSASYALMVDGENFVMDDEVSIRDSHATEADMADYIEILKKNGFTEVRDKDEEGNEKTFYRKLLRDDYKCYSSIWLDYDNGVNIKADKWYDYPKYEGLDPINKAIESLGYPALPESDNFTAYLGTDKAAAMSESWLYFFDYEMCMYVDIDYKDKDAAAAYVKDYEKTLAEAGFKAVKGADEDEESGSEEEEADTDRYESENGANSFRYNLGDDGKLSLQFKSEKYYTSEEVEKMIADAGFPAIDLSEPISCRDLKPFRKMQLGEDLKAFYTVSQEFESQEAAEAFLTAYEEALNAAGFERTSPDVVGTLKEIAIYNEDAGMYVALDYFPNEASVYFEFCAE